MPGISVVLSLLCNGDADEAISVMEPDEANPVFLVFLTYKWRQVRFVINLIFLDL